MEEAVGKNEAAAAFAGSLESAIGVGILFCLCPGA